MTTEQTTLERLRTFAKAGRNGLMRHTAASFTIDREKAAILCEDIIALIARCRKAESERDLYIDKYCTTSAALVAFREAFPADEYENFDGSDVEFAKHIVARAEQAESALKEALSGQDILSQEIIALRNEAVADEAALKEAREALNKSQTVIDDLCINEIEDGYTLGVLRDISRQIDDLRRASEALTATDQPTAPKQP